jgi:transposase-like protein
VRYSASQKTEIIRLVEQSPWPARGTLEKLGIPRSSFYRWYDRYQRGGPEALADRPSRPDRIWNRILVAHETSSLIKDTILTEEQEPVSVKGFAHPVRVYRVVGIYDELEKDSRIIREERQGVRLLVDLTKGDLASAIAAVENVLARLRD